MMDRKLRPYCYLLLSASSLLIATSRVHAYGSLGYDCAGCHASQTGPDPVGLPAKINNSNFVALYQPDGNVNPVERSGATDHGSLPYYTLTPGVTRTFHYTLQNMKGDYLNNGGRYLGIVTNNYQKNGITIGIPLTYTLGNYTGNTWTTQSPTVDPYYTLYPGSNMPTTGSAVPRDFYFTLTVPVGTTPDFYEFEWGFGEKHFTTPGLVEGGYQQLYIQVIPEPATLALAMPVLGAFLLVRGGRRLNSVRA